MAPAPAAQPTEKPKPQAAATPLAAAVPVATPSPVAAQAALARPAAFAPCTVCHTDKQGQRSGFGPNLFGVAGTKSGELGGYAFSAAMKGAGIVWTPDNLDKFIESPQAVVPGTKMAFAGVKDAAKRKAIVDYLLALK
ncbi:MAG: hypothetical protein IE933_00540 [Sphingomonadales bacterium]|nr:hypothetical protein [Sphingomonadales bacterium]MBD3772592.1 hypothetical protein [Paracoccaceae bacterium]